MAALVLPALLLIGACTRVATIQVVPPAPDQTAAAGVHAIWVAGFTTTPNRDVDLNGETVRVLRAHLKAKTSWKVIDTEPIITVGDAAEFVHRARWQRLATEHGAPLVVTGSVRLTTAPPVYARQYTGRRWRTVRRDGVVLETSFVVIDGRTGEVVGLDPPRAETLHSTDGRRAPLALYLELIDRAIPRVLRVIHAEPPAGIRYLLK